MMIPTIPLSFIYGNLELMVIMGPVISLSFIYHLSRESKYYISEAICAHILMFYSTIQIFYINNYLIIFIESIFCGSILTLFFGLSYYPEKYENYHSLQHIIAILWVSLIAVYHEPFIKI